VSKSIIKWLSAAQAYSSVADCLRRDTLTYAR